MLSDSRNATFRVVVGIHWNEIEKQTRRPRDCATTNVDAMIALTSSGANLYRSSLEDEEIALGLFKSCP
jgi:hypothetical protein